MNTLRRRLAIHVGAHKTASTFLQASLKSAKESLDKSGYTVLLREDIEQSELQRLLTANTRTANPKFIVSPELKMSWERKFMQNDSVIISSEDILSSVRVSNFFRNLSCNLKIIQTLFSDCEISMVIYTRSQADYIESAFVQHLHNGRVLNFKKYLNNELPHHLNWFKVVEEISSALSPERVSVVPFESISSSGSSAFLLNFFEHMGISPDEAADLPIVEQGRAANRSYSEKAVKIARQILPMMETRKEKVALRNFLQGEFSTATHPKPKFFTKEERMELFEIYQKSNRMLFETYMGEFDGKKLGYF